MNEIRLLPEPENAFDKHALAVHMRWLTVPGTEVWDPIGYVPAELAREVGALIASGEWAIERAYVRRIDAPEADAPRVLVRIEGKDLRQ